MMLSIESLSARRRSLAAHSGTAGPTLVRIRVHPPKLALLATPFPPRNGLLLSTMFHSALAALLMSLPILVRPRSEVPSTAELRAQAIFEPFLVPSLPTDAGGDPRMGEESEPAAKSSSAPGPSSQLHAPSVQLKRDYAGARTIVSNPPDAANGVQTIRRPDLVSPPNLAYPVRLPSLVLAPIIPSPPAPDPVKRSLGRPIAPSPPKRTTLRVSEPRIPNPAISVSKLKTSLLFPVRAVSPPPVQGPVQPSLSAAATSVAPKAGSGLESSGPTRPITRAALNAPKAAAVINAVVPPPDLAPVIPNAELASRFIVAPSPKPAPVDATAGGASGNLEGVASNATEKPPRSSVSGAAENKLDAIDTTAPANVSSSTASPAPDAAALAAPTPETTVSGISISGGVPGRSGRAAPTHLNPRGSYALTIVSGGSSGGASRDLGVFERREIVYTVYIPMTGVGDGRDCPMQYSLLSSGVADKGSIGLLTPPAVVKKVAATLPKDKIGADTSPVFITGIIDDNGDLQLLRAVHAMDVRAQAAVDALAQWLFLPAQLDGRPVATKVLIGVTVALVNEVGKN